MTPPTDTADAGPSLDTEPLSGIKSFDVTNDLLNEIDGLDRGASQPEEPAATPAAPAVPVDSTATAPTDAKVATPPAAPEVKAADSKTPLPGATPEPDPELSELLKTAKPMGYTVDGQARTFDAIRVIEGQGALIAPEHLERVQNTLATAERAITENKRLYQESQEWTALGGRQKLEDLNQQVAMLDAAGSKLLSILDDPTQLLMQNADGSIVRNEHAIALLKRELLLSSKEAGYSARDTLRTTVREQAETATQDTQRGQAIDHAITQLAGRFSGLTAADLQAAKSHFGPFATSLYRKATAQDAQQWGLTVGEWVVDAPKMVSWFEDRHAQRTAQKSETEKRTLAEAENAKRLAVPVPTIRPKSATAGPSSRASTNNAPPRTSSNTSDRADKAQQAMRNFRVGKFSNDTPSDT